MLIKLKIYNYFVEYKVKKCRDSLRLSKVKYTY